VKDTKSREISQSDSASINGKQELPANTVSAIQGFTASPEQDALRWTRQDGSIYHAICQQEVQDQIEDVDRGIEVNNNYPVTVLDGDGVAQNGLIDTYVAHQGHNTVIDYKTNDMSCWTVADAVRFGHEHGSQVQGYIKSPDMPSNAQGYVLSVGKVSSSADVMQAYGNALAQHGVKCVFVDGIGDPNDVVAAVRKCIKQTRA
jgi:hypothetical protein